MSIQTGSERTHSDFYPNMTSLWSPHHLWSVNLSMTVGQDQAPASPAAVCSGQVRPGVQGWQRCRLPQPVPCGDGEEERNSMDLQAGQEKLNASCWRQQRCSGHLYRPGAECLRVLTASATASSSWWKSIWKTQVHLIKWRLARWLLNHLKDILLLCTFNHLKHSSGSAFKPACSPLTCLSLFLCLPTVQNRAHQAGGDFKLLLGGDGLVTFNPASHPGLIQNSSLMNI